MADRKNDPMRLWVGSWQPPRPTRLQHPADADESPPRTQDDRLSPASPTSRPED